MLPPVTTLPCIAVYLRCQLVGKTVKSKVSCTAGVRACLFVCMQEKTVVEHFERDTVFIHLTESLKDMEIGIVQ